MISSDNIETNNITYTFQIGNEEYSIAPLLDSPELPSKIQTFAIITSMQNSAHDIIFDILIDSWKDFYEASMDQNGENLLGYIILNITIQEASELAEKSDCDFFAFWNSNALNILRTKNTELIDVWQF